MKKFTVFVGRLADDTNYLTIINENQGREINSLHEEIRYLREQNGALLRKLGITEQIKIDLALESLVPIGGFKPMRTRLKEAEAKSREEFEIENAKNS